MGLSLRKISLMGLSTLLCLGMFVPANPAIANDKDKKPKPNFSHVSRHDRHEWDDDHDWDDDREWDDDHDWDDDRDDDHGWVKRDSWDGILYDLGRNYNDDVSRNILDALRDNRRLQSTLFDLFGGQSGGTEIIQDIVVDILLGRDNNDYDRYRRSLYYKVDPYCLPPGLRQNYYRGKPVPSGILKKCGRTRF